MWEHSCEMSLFLAGYYQLSVSFSDLNKMSLQDVPVPKGKGLKAHILFDNEAQTILVRNSFGEKAGWTYEPASYTLAGVGSAPV